MNSGSKERGVSIVEYALLIGLLISVAGLAYMLLARSASGRFSTTAQQMGGGTAPEEAPASAE